VTPSGQPVGVTGAGRRDVHGVQRGARDLLSQLHQDGLHRVAAAVGHHEGRPSGTGEHQAAVDRAVLDHAPRDREVANLVHPERGGGLQDALDEAAATFAQAQADHHRREAARQLQVAEERAAWNRNLADETRKVEVYNAHIDRLAAGFRDHDRFAVSEYVQMALDRSPYPSGFPEERHAGYVPESALLAVEWFLPIMEIIPADKSFRHIKARKVVEATARPATEIHRLYLSVISQVALRTLREVFTVTPEDMISTVVFNGLVNTIDPRTGIAVQPHFITLRATREQFAPLILDQPKFSPVQCVQKYFFADISPHPEELIAVDPVMPFSMADPRIIEPIDVLSTIDQRPNLLELKPAAFEAFIQNLFTKEGLDVKLFRPGGDGGIDCMAYDPDPIRGGKIAIQAKLYTRTVAPTHVRDLWGTVQHEGALKGIMVTTSGFGPDSYKFAAGKPLSLVDGTGLLALCQKHGIPARILNTGGSAKARSLGAVPRVGSELRLVLQCDLSSRFPAIVHQALPSVIRSAPPLKEEAIDPLACDVHLARLGVGRYIGREAVKALGKTCRHGDRKRNLLRC
jgi:restriction system protein